MARKIHYKINGYSHAERIAKNFVRQRTYLLSLVENVTGDSEFAESLDWNGLLHQGYKIRDNAYKILKNRTQAEERARQRQNLPQQLELNF